MILDKIGIILSDTSRSRAYIQVLINNRFIPNSIILMEPESTNNFLGTPTTKIAPVDMDDSFKDLSLFNPNIPVKETLAQHQLKFVKIDTKSINDKSVIETISKSNEEYFIYSGFGGIILKRDVLKIGKKFIHVHGGYLPQYKGSTCNYYSIIEDNSVGASSIIMTEEIDGGPILLRKTFSAPKDKEMIDHFYDSLIRANILLETIQSFTYNGCFSEIKYKNIGDMYFVIHPVLKHIAILK